MQITMNDMATADQLESAFQWLCKRRRKHPPNSDIWDFRRSWHHEKERIREELLRGEYAFSLLSRITLRNGEIIHMWCSRDALVLKCLAKVLGRWLPVSKNCCHVKGHGGAKGAVRSVVRNLRVNQFVLRTDIASYYGSIDHDLLFEQMARVIKDRRVLNLLWRFMKRCAESGGVFHDFECGISRGCPLSPILGAWFLNELDRRMEQLGLFYARFMDDMVVLAPTRWKLKRAVSVLNQVLEALKLSKHPAKTFIGRVAKGFDFLGYHIEPGQLKVSLSTLQNFAERIARLYEQGADQNRIGIYVRHWHIWAFAEEKKPLDFSLSEKLGLTGLAWSYVPTTLNVSPRGGAAERHRKKGHCNREVTPRPPLA